MKSHKLQKLNEALTSQFGIELDFNSSIEHLVGVMSLYDDKKRGLMMEGKDVTDPDYAKAVLIAEAVRIYLKEIAPKRNKRSRN